MRKILSIFLCFAMLIGYIPAGVAMADEEPAGSNADLSSLTVAGSVYYDLIPVFNAGTTGYAVDVPNDVSSVEITATAADTAATLEINGTAATSGSAQTVDNLSVGDNTIAVAVTARDGATVKTYTTTVKRGGVSQSNNADLSGHLDVKIMLLSAEVNGDTRRGPWVFEFKTNGDQLALDTHEIKLDYAFTLDNGQRIALEKYTSNDLGQKIYYSKNRQGTSYDIALQGKDDLGNKVEFFMTHEEDGKGIFKLSTIDGNLNDDARVLTLTPYAVKFPEQSGKLSNDYKPVGPEFTIDLVTPLHRDVLL